MNKVTVMGMYFDEDKVPDFGSVNLVETKKNDVRNYTLISTDKAKLQLITNAYSGSLAYCTDTKELLIYNAFDKSWNEV